MPSEYDDLWEAAAAPVLLAVHGEAVTYQLGASAPGASAPASGAVTAMRSLAGSLAGGPPAARDEEAHEYMTWTVLASAINTLSSGRTPGPGDTVTDAGSVAWPVVRATATERGGLYTLLSKRGRVLA